MKTLDYRNLLERLKIIARTFKHALNNEPHPTRH